MHVLQSTIYSTFRGIKIEDVSRKIDRDNEVDEVCVMKGLAATMVDSPASQPWGTVLG